MKGLLQSKKFKKSLGKWLLMYVLCMGVFTTVITYSKYISNMLSSGGEARVSKFNVNLKFCDDEKCENTNTEKHEATKVRPSSNMSYYFAVDTTQLEVNADLILTVTTDRHFKIDKIEEITNDGYEEIKSISKNSSDGDTASITNKVIAGDSEMKKYKVTVSYNDEVIDYNRENCKSLSGDCKVVNGVIKNGTDLPRYIFNEKQVFDVLKVGYSAVQTR